MLGATILVFGSHQVVGDFSLLYWIGIQACMCNDVPCAQALQWLSLRATAPLRAWALWTQMTQSTSMPTFTLTVNTTGCLLARWKPFLPPWQHGRKCLSGRIADVINCNKKSIIQSVCHKNLKCFELRCDNYKSLLQSTAGFFWVQSEVASWSCQLCIQLHRN